MRGPPYNHRIGRSNKDMAHAVEERPPLHMGLPISNGKIAIWLFLVTEIMFFTGLIGAYIVLRQSAPDFYLDAPTGQRTPHPAAGGEPPPGTQHVHWPTPEDVHLAEWAGAVNTFVLICSSLTIVLAHNALGRGNARKAATLIGVT